MKIKAIYMEKVLAGAYPMSANEEEEFINDSIEEAARVYDPRKKKFINSNNPALIFANLITHLYLQENGKVELTVLNPDREKFWEEIGKLADACDKEFLEKE